MSRQPKDAAGYCDKCNVVHFARRWDAKRAGWTITCPTCKAIIPAEGTMRKKRFVYLRSLGFETYRQYLASELWAQIRAEVIGAVDGKCFRCGGRAVQVHHTTYSLAALSGKDKSTLRALCRGCHHFIEFHPDGRKARQSVANKKLDGTYDPSAKHRSKPYLGRRKKRKTKATIRHDG